MIFQNQKKILKLLNKKERFSLAVLVCLIFIGTLLETIGISAVVPVIISVSNPIFLTNNHLASEILQAFNLNDQRDIVLFMVLLLAFINFIKFIYLSFLLSSHSPCIKAGLHHWSVRLFASVFGF